MKIFEFIDSLDMVDLLNYAKLKETKDKYKFSLEELIDYEIEKDYFCPPVLSCDNPIVCQGSCRKCWLEFFNKEV